MKLLFSEAAADYGRYLYPYVVWAIPEAGEAPADLFNAGFLPSARGFDQFYLCRQLRVELAKFKPSSENRRILRKGEGITMRLVPRAEFELSPARREFFLKYAEVRYGPGVMPPERLELLFNSPLATHLLVFTDAATGAELGVVLLYLAAPRVAFYRYSFYDLDHFNRSLGLFLMTSATQYFAEQKFQHLYLGTCYAERALYKTQFAGVEFFNGFRWSQNLEELKYLLHRDPDKHLLETMEYRDTFHEGGLGKIAAAGGFTVTLPQNPPAPPPTV
jgi:arginyl-tRNA--protein-N-Asp/Glu arginylyltransferase